MVATITLPKPDPGYAEPLVEAFELERRGAEVRVRVESDDSDVEGWVSRRHLTSHVEVNELGMLGALGGRGPTIALATDAPLIVRTRGRVVRVGTAHAATLGCLKPANTRLREVEIVPEGGWLGLSGIGPVSEPQPPEAKLFVVPARGETCVDGGAGPRR